MDYSSILISSGISSGIYILYKLSQTFYYNYYIKSACHQNTLEITIAPIDENKEIVKIDIEKELRNIHTEVVKHTEEKKNEIIEV